MEIYNKQERGYIEVWLTNEEQQMYDREELTERLLARVKKKKCRVAFFLSGSEDPYPITENLLLTNLKTIYS
ncbi:hypothetical protein [Ruminococcus albus]|uniref:Uncharacterized protein n=1 Tax=Ruminococcus albus TaxID=1264 RepID=A0A1H7GT83_RUMAL|nr:hypothetical protein [Ruminococcus albus]SEK41393.1 hypothetical protein SAMN05216469_102258 [Ruminococcus albus]